MPLASKAAPEACLERFWGDMRAAAYRFMGDDPEDLVQDAALRLFEAGKLGPGINRAYCCNAVRFAGMQRWSRLRTEFRVLQELKARYAMGLLGAEVYGRSYRGSMDILKLAKQIRHRERQAKRAIGLAAIAERVAQHSKKCKVCARGIPSMLTYCSKCCEKKGKLK
jgi:hypothetical protein